MREVVVVTGAAGGIGRALCARYGRAGARIAMLDLERDRLDEAQRELSAQGIEAHGVELDITSMPACERAMDEVLGRFGRIDALINCAGTVHRSAFRDTDIEVFRKVMDVNYFGALHCTKAALPSLEQSKGVVVTISSVAGIAPLYGRSGYAASKHALHGLFESARGELAERGVRVLMVCPSFTRSPFEQRAMGPDGRPAGTARSKVGRLAQPEEVAEAVFQGDRAGRRLVVLSPVGKVTYLLSRFAPGLYEWIMVRRLRSELARGTP